MIEVDAVDAQLHSLRDWVITAGQSVRIFFNRETGTFWRDIIGKQQKDQGVHPTSTCRAFFAEYEYLRFLLEEDLTRRDSIADVKAVLRGVYDKYLSDLPKNPKRVRQSASNDINMFTDSHLLLAVSASKHLHEIMGSEWDTGLLFRAAKEFADQNRKTLMDWKGGRIWPKDDIHDFVTLHMVRGLDAYYGWKAHESEELSIISERVRETVLRLLAYDSAGVSSKFDPNELAFSTALLNRFRTPEASQLTERAVKSVVDSQERDGSWPTARMISYEGKSLLHVASYEVALTLAHLLLRKIYDQDFRLCNSILPALGKTFDLVKSYYTIVGDVTGWANDHTRRTGLVESWATAIVLDFLIYYHDLLFKIRQSQILAKYDSHYPAFPVQLYWPDMVSALRCPSWVNLDDIDSIADPSENAELTKAIKTQVLDDIAHDWTHRPKNASLILYGPPGSRKTSMMMRMAEILRWPILILSPHHFLQKGGLEGFESSSAEIFADLFHIRRAVVLFDDCEDFFKTRPVNEHVESRTVGAFITAGMLSRLQALRQRRWILFALATNSAPEKLDPAVIREGRFDFAQEVPYPTVKAQIRYLHNNFGSPLREVCEKAVVDYNNKFKTKKKRVPVSFSVLDRFVELCTEKSPLTSESALAILEDMTASHIRSLTQ